MGRGSGHGALWVVEVKEHGFSFLKFGSPRDIRGLFGIRALSIDARILSLA